jgi:hypothetical protein
LGVHTVSLNGIADSEVEQAHYRDRLLKRKNVGKPLFPMADAESYLRTFIPSLERSDGTLRWSSGDGISELSVTPIEERTFDGLLVSEMVMLTHTSPAFAGLSPDMVARLNSWATISSLVLADRSQPTRLVAKVGIFTTDREAAERVYAPLLCTEAAINGWHAARIPRGQFRGDPEQSPLRMTSQDPPLDKADFEAIKAITDRGGYLGSLGDKHFVVEFPWDAGAKTNMLRREDIQLRARQDFSDDELDSMAARTSLLQIKIAEHPLYGKGVHSTLELPLPLDDPTIVQTVNELNAWELSGADLPPHFGAWCIGIRAPTYVSFIPTQFCFAGILHNLTIWMAARQARVREWLNASPSRH